MGRLEIRLLGTPRVELDSIPVEFDTRKATALLAYLAVTQERCARDTLAALLWPDYDQTRARAALRRTLSTLNQALSREGDHWLDIDREAVSLRLESGFTLDVSQFRQCLAACRSHGHTGAQVCPACATPLEQAASIYREDFLSGFTLKDSAAFDDWQFFQTENLRRELQGVLENLAFLHNSQGELDKGIAVARRWLALDTLNETAHRQLMLLYAWAGQRSAALRQYRECVRILKQELDVPPLEETTRLNKSVLEGKIPPAPAPLQPETSPAWTAESHSSAEVGPHIHSFPLVGRAEEWETLLHAYKKVSADGYLFVLKGEAGIGKTRLAEEFLAYVQAKGGTALPARCYEGESGLAYGPLIDGLRAALSRPDWHGRLAQLPAHWIKEAARLLPELDAFPVQAGRSPAPAQSSVEPLTVSLAEPGAQSRFFEGLRQILAAFYQGSVPGVIFLDDVHWADAATMDFLTYVARRLKGFPCFLLFSLRPDAAPASERIDRLAAALQREGFGNQTALRPLNTSEVDELVRSLTPSGQVLPDQLNQRLQTEAEGLPFFVVEYLSIVLENLKSGSPLDWSIPGSVRELLRSRLSAVSQTGWQLLATAAVIGRSFHPDILHAASGRNDSETLEALESLVAQGLIRERSPDEVILEPSTGETSAMFYDFSHEKLRAVVYEETSLTRRRILHRRVAEALANQGRARLTAGGLASQIAYHYRSAGANELAARYYKLAGEYARSLFANNEALAHFRAAMELGNPAAADIHEAVGDLLTLQGEYSAALVSYETANGLGDPGTSARLAHKLGNVHDRRGEWERAESSFHCALEILEQSGEMAKKASLYADWSLTAFKRCQPERAEVLVKQALELAINAADLYSQAQANNILGVLARSAGNLVQAKVYLKQSLAFAEEMGDAYIRSAALNNLALVYADLGDLERAIELAKSALEVCIRLGDRHREAAIHNNLADFFHAAGQSEQAMASLKKAVVIFAEIGLEAGSLSPEIWNLREW
jgi:DNA-binding SARP family transcriptional activator/Tfp pilus assembly protein PilF